MLLPQPWGASVQSAFLPKTDWTVPHPARTRGLPCSTKHSRWGLWALALPREESGRSSQPWGAALQGSEHQGTQGACRALVAAAQAASGKQNPPALPHSPPGGLNHVWKRPTLGEDGDSGIRTGPQLPGVGQSGLSFNKRQGAAPIRPLLMFPRNVLPSQSHPAWTGTTHEN